MNGRIFELALETLEKRKSEIEVEIAGLQARLGSGIQITSTAVAVPEGRKGRTPEQRKAHSERMKAYWAAKRGKSAKPKATPKKAGKDANELRSEKMKAYWAEQRAQKARR